MRAQPTTNTQANPQGRIAAQGGYVPQQDTSAPSPPTRPASQSTAMVPARLVRRLVVDTVLSVLLAFEMCYQLTDNAMHELIGALLFVGMAVHLLLSRKWLAGAFRPSKGAGGRRVALLIVAILLMVDATVLAVSSVVISSTLAEWGLGLGSLNASGMWSAIHSLSAYGLCAITVVHLAMHWSVIAKAMGVRYAPARRNAIGYAVGGFVGAGDGTGDRRDGHGTGRDGHDGRRYGRQARFVRSGRPDGRHPCRDRCDGRDGRPARH